MWEPHFPPADFDSCEDDSGVLRDQVGRTANLSVGLAGLGMIMIDQPNPTWGLRKRGLVIMFENLAANLST